MKRLSSVCPGCPSHLASLARLWSFPAQAACSMALSLVPSGVSGLERPARAQLDQKEQRRG